MTTAAVVSLSIVAPPARRCPPGGKPNRATSRIDATILPFKPRNAARDPDHALVRAIATGSKSAMRALFLRHHARVLRYIAHTVRDHALAEDLASEVFLGVWRRAGRFEGRSTVTTWLYGIARHKALTALEARPVCRDDDLMLSVEDPAPGPAGELEAKDDVALLRRCLAALSREHRQIIDLVYYGEKSIREIADMLGIGLNTAKTRIFYARKRLAALMASAGYAPART